MKNINKFSILAVLFTILYMLIPALISWINPLLFSDETTVYFSKVGLWVFNFFVFGSLIASFVLGIISIIKTIKKGGVERWLMILLTLWNIGVLIYCVKGLINLYTIYN